jgi:hypothetical protein
MESNVHRHPRQFKMSNTRHSKIIEQMKLINSVRIDKSFVGKDYKTSGKPVIFL